jgi:Ca-activated chloride channel family protein
MISLAQPRWGYTFEDVKRKGLDLLIAVDTSRSMLSNDVQPNRLERVKLAARDLINELQGDRVGLIAFAGRAFLQAPLTIDYEAVWIVAVIPRRFRKAQAPGPSTRQAFEKAM